MADALIESVTDAVAEFEDDAVREGVQLGDGVGVCVTDEELEGLPLGVS